MSYSKLCEKKRKFKFVNIALVLLPLLLAQSAEARDLAYLFKDFSSRTETEKLTLIFFQADYCLFESDALLTSNQKNTLKRLLTNLRPEVNDALFQSLAYDEQLNDEMREPFKNIACKELTEQMSLKKK